ncbi:MAG: siphovirus Gp157 family protein [Peptostreptococcaceae bacterium]
MRLYEISQEVREVLEAMQEADNKEAYTDTLEALQLEFKDKADSIACYIKEVLAEAEALKVEEEKLKARRKTKEAEAENLKQYLYREMQVAGMKKFETARNVLSIRKTAGALKIVDDTLFIDKHLSTEFVKVELIKTIDKNKLKEAIKQGQVFDGVTIEQGESFSIK